MISTLYRQQLVVESFVPWVHPASLHCMCSLIVVIMIMIISKIELRKAIVLRKHCLHENMLLSAHDTQTIAM